MKLVENYKQQIIDLSNQRKSSTEIAEILGFCKTTIRVFKRKHKIEKRSCDISQKQLEFLIGCIMGDGSLPYQPCSKYPEFSCQHGPKQYEYNSWKAEVLASLEVFLKKYIRNKPSKKTGKIYEYSYLRTKINSNLLPLYQEFYGNGKKRITKELMNNYSDLSLAVHYMDDGNCAKRNSYCISTNSFDLNSLIIFTTHLKEMWNIDTVITKDHRVRIKACSKYIFDSLIRKYVEQIPSMTYKLIVSKQEELLETPTLERQEDNQQPSLDSNIFEGSTTNNRIQTSNVEDSNVNTSILL